MRCVPVLLVVLALHCAADSGFEAWRSGQEADTFISPALVAPGLMLAGGGGEVSQAFKWFSRRCGGGDIVVLRVSGGAGYQEYLYQEIGGFASVTTLALREPSAASDPLVLQRVREAEGVFLAGGDQARYIRDWVGSPLGAALQSHINAGKPIGGTSAGLAVLGEFSFHALNDTVTSTEALADPFEPRVTLGEGLVGHPLLKGVLTDSHFMSRERTGRLAVFLARLALVGGKGVRGLGVDEATAVCVDAEGVGQVMSDAGGSAWIVWIDQGFRCVAGEPFFGTATICRVEAGGRLRFPSLEPASQTERLHLRWGPGEQPKECVSKH
jgi:cyanophycinase